MKIYAALNWRNRKQSLAAFLAVFAAGACGYGGNCSWVGCRNG